MVIKRKKKLIKIRTLADLAISSEKIKKMGLTGKNIITLDMSLLSDRYIIKKISVHNFCNKILLTPCFTNNIPCKICEKNKLYILFSKNKKEK